MKRYIFVIGLISMIFVRGEAQVLISMDCTATPDNSAMLDIQSTTQGLLVPRIPQINAISNPATGLVIFDQNRNDFYYYNGSQWLPMNQADGDAWGVDGEDQSSAIGRTGNTGIGTINPGATLDISGKLWVTSTGNSVFLGEGAGQNDDFSDNNNVFVGAYSGYQNTDGFRNNAVGAGTLHSNTSGDYNIAVGYTALYSNQTADCNVAIGTSALYHNTTGEGNTAGGGYALRSNTTGEHNTSIGKHSLDRNTDGSFNCAAGEDALYQNQHNDYSSALGRSSLYHSRADYNIALGRNAGSNITTGQRNIIIGAGINAPSDTASYQLNIGNLIYGTLNLGRTGTMANPTATLDIDGAIHLQTVSSPSGANPGDIYFDGTHLYGYNGTVWLRLDNCADCL